jgi:hypothetical protein
LFEPVACAEAEQTQAISTLLSCFYFLAAGGRAFIRMISLDLITLLLEQPHLFFLERFVMVEVAHFSARSICVLLVESASHVLVGTI